MRNIWIVCLLLTSLVTIGVVAAHATISNSRGVADAAHPGVAAHRQSLATQKLLLGNRRVWGGMGSDEPGRAESFPFKTRVPGRVRALRVYVDSRSTAKKLVAGLYRARHRRPGVLLTSGSLRSPTRGAWNTVRLRPRGIHARTTYWIAILGRHGRLDFRHRASHPCRSAMSRRALAVLPTRWMTGKTRSACPISAYIVGTVTTASQKPSSPGGSSSATSTTPAGGGKGSGNSGGGSGGGANGGGGSGANGGGSGGANGGGSGGGSNSGTGPTTVNGSVPCALTHAAGYGPNSCWATHTGVQGATGYTEAQIESNPAAYGFTTHTGDLTITKPNTTIDHEWIIGCVKIADGADNTTIKDSLITPNGDACSGDNAGGSAINTGQGSNIATNTLIEDTTVDGGDQGYGSHTAGITSRCRRGSASQPIRLHAGLHLGRQHRPEPRLVPGRLRSRLHRLHA